MSLFSFLSSAKVEEVVPGAKGGGGPRKQRNPKPALLAIRLWADGSTYPSQALVDRFDLEYKKATITKEEVTVNEPSVADFPDAPEKFEKAMKVYQASLIKPKTRNLYEFPDGTGNGFDVIPSDKWGQFTSEGKFLFISPVSKSLPKVDLFASVKYQDDGNPTNTVMTQGSPSEWLLDAVASIYGITLGDDTPYVDLIVFSEYGEEGSPEYVNITEKFSKKLSTFPKVIARGKEKGEADYVRRENAAIWGLIPASLAGVTEGEEGEEEVEEEEKGDTNSFAAEEDLDQTLGGE